MRTALLRRRRRGTIDPITASYDAILATDPTVPVLFRLRSYRGQQVLFQDAACTIPVTAIGDPIGGVRHPLTGVILAVQTTDAARPVWGGEDVGAVFDGAQSLSGAPDGPFLAQNFGDVDKTVSYKGVATDLSLQRTPVSTRQNSDTNWSLRLTPSSQLFALSYAANTNFYAIVANDGDSCVWAYSKTNVNQKLYEGGTELNSSGLIGHTDADGVGIIGSDSVLTRPFVGNLGRVLLWQRTLSPQEIEMEAALP